MKKTIKLAVVAALALGTTSAFATNGDVMIGQGAKSRSMGGVGIAKSFGAESGLANPAMISSVKDSEFTFVVTAFAPNVAFKSDAMANTQVPAGTKVPVNSQTSDASFSVIPELAYATSINDKLVAGLSVSGTAGMGTDYDDAKFGTAQDNGAFRMKTALSLLKVAVPVSYKLNDNLTLGLAGILQYGTLQMTHMVGNGAGNPMVLRKDDMGSDTGYGMEFGASYSAGDFIIGAVHKTEIGMTYDKTISTSITAFGGAAQTGVSSGDNLNQPAETGVGISYTMGESTLTADYKLIEWGNAAGYKDFGWENQDVYAVGYEYAAKSWAFRAGYNYAKSPIAEQDGSGATAGMAAYGNSVKNFFNLSGFPGIVDTHYTIGGGYSISEALSLDGSFIYVPEVTETFNTSGLTQGLIQMNGGAPTGAEVSSATVTHSQMALTLAMTYKF